MWEHRVVVFGDVMDTDSSLTFNFSHVAHEESVSRLKNNAKQKQSTVDKKNQNAKRMLFNSFRTLMIKLMEWKDTISLSRTFYRFSVAPI